MYRKGLTSAAGAIGMSMAALQLATKYSMKRKAFGKIIRRFEGVSFKTADSLCISIPLGGILHTAAQAWDFDTI